MKFALFFILCCFVINQTIVNSVEIVTNASAGQLENLNVADLIIIALKNDSILQEANQIFRKKFGHLLINISIVSQYSKYFLIWNNVLAIDHSIAVNFMKAFGRSIERLEISFKFIPGEKHKEIGRLVNIYCSETLIEFHGKYGKGGAFSDMEKPYLKVERANFEGIRIRDENSMDIDKLFPAIRLLNLSSVDVSIFDHPYPHLIELNIEMTTSNEFVSLIEKNQKLEILRLLDTSAEFLKVASEKLPELKILEFNMPYNLSNTEIHFQRVQELSIHDRYKYFKSGKLFFKQLTKFELVVLEKITDGWVEFIGENKGLKTLTVGNAVFKDNQLLDISSKLKHLKEARIYCNVLINLDSIETFLDNNPQMQHVQLSAWPMGSELFYKSLIEKFDKKWDVTPLDPEYFHLNLTRFSERSHIVPESDVESSNNVNDNSNPNLNSNPNSITSGNLTENSDTDSAAPYTLLSTALRIALLIIMIKKFVL